MRIRALRFCQPPPPKPVELDLGVLGAVARQKFEIFDGQEELGALRVMQFEAIMRRAAGLDRLEADEAADAVIDVDDDVARAERADFAQEILGLARRLAAAHQAVAENILLADDDEIARLESRLEPDDGHGDALRRQREGLRERRDIRFARKAMVGEDMDQALARAVGPRRHDGALALRLPGLDVVDGRA